MGKVNEIKQKIFGPAIGWAVDKPGATNLLLLGLVTVHAVASLIWPVANIWSLIFPEGSEPTAVSLAVVGTGALLAGFAGVVVVFGLQGTSERFRRLRRSGGDELKENWSSMSSSGFWTMAVALASSLAFSATWNLPGGLLLELSLLVLGHGSIRLMWMLGNLVEVVSADDQLADVKDRTRKTEDQPFNLRRG